MYCKLTIFNIYDLVLFLICLGELQHYELFAFVLILWSHGLSALHSQYIAAAGLHHHLDVPAVLVEVAELCD